MSIGNNGPLQGRIGQAKASANDNGYSPDSAKYNPERSNGNRAARASMAVASVDERVERILQKINDQLRPMLREAIETRAHGRVVSETFFQNGREKSGDAKYNRTYLFDNHGDE
jgi:hypothetical protein